MSDLIEVPNLATLNDVLESNDAVLVEFGAAWCGPCRQFLPHFEKFADGNNEVACVKVDIETDDFALKYGFSSVPQVWLFKNGEKAAEVRARTAPLLRKEIAQLLS